MILGLFEDVKLFNGTSVRRRTVEKGFSAACPSLLTVLDGRAARICGNRGRPLNRTAHNCLSLQRCALKADACCDLLTV